MVTKKQSGDLIWATEVLEVYKALGTDVTELSTPSATFQLRFVRLPENTGKFLTQTSQKASEILTKYGITEAAEAAQKIDLKTVAVLQEHLAAAVNASSLDNDSLLADMLA